MRIQLTEAISLLRSGQVISIPTETVYGLAAWPSSPHGVQKVFQLKKRPPSNPLILHLAETDQILHYISSVPDNFFLLAKRFWPGPLTMVLNVKKECVPNEVRASLDTCAFRCPSHPLTRLLLQEVFPLVAPSANLSGKPSSTKPEHVEADFGIDFPVLDGGSCDRGVESTIIAFVNGAWQIARQGAISQQELTDVLGYQIKCCDAPSEKPLCPGQLFRHYAPNASLVLGHKPFDGSYKYVVGFSDRCYEGAEKVFFLGSSTSCDEVAFRLYDVLRALDCEQIDVAWVDMQMPKFGLWQTIYERISRAANQ